MEGGQWRWGTPSNTAAAAGGGDSTTSTTRTPRIGGGGQQQGMTYGAHPLGGSTGLLPSVSAAHQIQQQPSSIPPVQLHYAPQQQQFAMNQQQPLDVVGTGRRPRS